MTRCGKAGVPLTAADHTKLLAAVADGLTDADIASAWAMPHATIKWRVKKLYQWLGALNRAHAVALGYQRGHLVTAETAAGDPPTNGVPGSASHPLVIDTAGHAT